ncbi:NAD-dependent epimerase/dehydratase family protein [Aquipseudomonas campi]|uniref:NAD-dependent epimerase/dehydratase family protein n=1 Tax=Aquipseudomonas campi TaxID=2731681 RepID=A0A6M8FDL3_9GAMM|nr:NAD-dependent epimerase/dehydratase family protein [Pseudomonas campi]QKE65461.1 NAD-dependent epimerase/dehydratase family protein [Pseudomonas campi]
MNILITGGCGFIGTSLIQSLINDHGVSDICVLDNLSEGSFEDLQEVGGFVRFDAGSNIPEEGLRFVEGDIRDYEVVEKCCRKVGGVVHLAANTGVAPSVENPRMDMESNVIGVLNLLEGMRVNAINKFVFASSGAPAGAVEPPIHEEIAPHPVSPYGASKLAGEGYCSAYYHSFGINTIALRFGNVFGPRSKNKSSVIAKFIRQALSGQVCEVYGDGAQTRDFIYIDDLVRAIVMAFNAPLGGEIFQIASGGELSVSEAIDEVSSALGKFGFSLAVVKSSPRVGDVRRNYSDTSKAARMLGWQPEVPFALGVEKTVKYFIDRL